MKKSLFSLVCAAALLTLASCERGGIRERPKDIEYTGARAEVYQRIMASFPEGKNVKTSQQPLFEATATKHVVLKSESPVYITFISEGASLANTFGWYSYNPNSKPGSRSEVETHILFPHVSERVLRQGDRLQIGKGSFPAGTVIGFFLIIDGWEQGEVHEDRETFYTNIEFNTDQQQQHVLFREKETGDFVLAFEDQLTSRASDDDFNDIIFTVTDNKDDKPVVNFELSNVKEL